MTEEYAIELKPVLFYEKGSSIAAIAEALLFSDDIIHK